jgi:NAD(P)-dependent dehydrogenase (short-subunit alcohol dehydrogenase family)
MKRNILVVGASRGVGAAVAQFYGQNGDNVISVSRTPSEIGEWVGADISTPEGINQGVTAVSTRAIDAIFFLRLHYKAALACVIKPKQGIELCHFLKLKKQYC